MVFPVGQRLNGTGRPRTTTWRPSRVVESRGIDYRMLQSHKGDTSARMRSVRLNTPTGDGRTHQRAVQVSHRDGRRPAVAATTGTTSLKEELDHIAHSA